MRLWRLRRFLLKIMFVDELKKKYQERLDKVDYKDINPAYSPTIYLFQKWGFKVTRGWYGFSLESAPFVWALIIHEFLEWLETKCPNFEIHQQKVKMGGYRCYVDLKCQNEEIVKEVRAEISFIESWLFHKDLIY